MRPSAAAGESRTWPRVAQLDMKSNKLGSVDSVSSVRSVTTPRWPRNSFLLPRFAVGSACRVTLVEF